MAFEVEKQNVIDGVTTLAQVAEKKVADLQNSEAVLTQAVLTLKDQLAADDATVTNLRAQLAQLGSVKVYDQLESQQPHTNLDKSVGGSGLGTGGWKAPGIECAELWILDSPTAPAPNFVDEYDTWRVPKDGMVTRFKLETKYLFPTAADVAACQCIEWEGRQVTDDQKLVIIAGQAQYSGGQLRYFDWEKRAWLSFGVSIQKPAPLVWTSVVMEGHRDATTIYYDAMTFNGTRYPMTQKYPMLPTTWTPLLWAAMQLDDTGAVNGFRVKIKDVKLTVSQ